MCLFTKLNASMTSHCVAHDAAVGGHEKPHSTKHKASWFLVGNGMRGLFVLISVAPQPEICSWMSACIESRDLCPHSQLQFGLALPRLGCQSVPDSLRLSLFSALFLSPHIRQICPALCNAGNTATLT
jgi:hypothetical protein